jgi:hypothetical protein
MGRSGIENRITAFSAVPAGQNLLITVWNSGRVPSRNEKIIKESEPEADRVCRKQKEISAAAIALVNLSESIGVKER